MALRTVALRLGCTRSPFARALQFRASNGGKVLSEEEKAAENIYIRKMERERLEKAKKGLKPEEVTAESFSSETKATITDASSDSTKNIAVVAGVVAIVAAGWWYFRSSSKKNEEEKE